LRGAAISAKDSAMTRRSSRVGAAARGALWTGLALIALFFGLVMLYAVVDPVSTLMLARAATGRPYERIAVPLDAVAPVAIAAVIVSEDATFCTNDGVDWGALREVVASAGEGGPSRGASTLTMQTVKNLFLWPGRSPLRKGLEIPMALVLGKLWPKRQVLEVYLNVAEWGDGTFGVEAAARRYFHKSARALDPREGALLAAALPNPFKRDPTRPTGLQRRRAETIMMRVAADPDALKCL
jgi:monofunctional biosynthetic peptidoglycan transglycosylase